MSKPTITSEMKAECIGSYTVDFWDACEKCINGHDVPCTCEGEQEDFSCLRKEQIPWNTCKDIYQKMYSLSPEAKELAALRAENEALKAKAIELCAAVENKEEFPPHKFALRCLMLVNQVRKLAGYVEGGSDE